MVSLTGNNSRKATFAYDAEHQRIWQKNQTVDGSGVTTNSQTVHLNPGNGAELSYEKECQPDCETGTTSVRTQNRHYLRIAGMTVGVHIVNSQSGGTGTQY